VQTDNLVEAHHVKEANQELGQNMKQAKQFTWQKLE
jgi:hypothetical protein